MAYIPNNLGAFIAAYSGAIAGMSVSGRVITDPIAADYAGQTQVAFAFAQEFDTLYAGPTGTLEFTTIEEAVEGMWQSIAPPSTDAQNLVPATFAPLCDAIIALLQEGDATFAAQGVPTTVPLPGGDEQVKIDFLDTTPGFLGDKIVAGTGLTFTVLNPGGNEQIQVSLTTTPVDELVKVSNADTTANFLFNKLQAGIGITIDILNPGGDEQVEITATFGSGLVLVSATDTIFDFLRGKIVDGAQVTYTLLNPGGNEQLQANVIGFTEASGPDVLSIQAIADGQVLTRVGSNIIGRDPFSISATLVTVAFAQPALNATVVVSVDTLVPPFVPNQIVAIGANYYRVTVVGANSLTLQLILITLPGTPSGNLITVGSPIVISGVPVFSDTITVPTPALVAGVLGYLDVDISLQSVFLIGINVNDQILACPKADLVPAGATNGFYIGCRVSALNTIRFTFVGTLPGGDVPFLITYFPLGSHS